jgi:hypothetical protein
VPNFLLRKSKNPIIFLMPEGAAIEGHVQIKRPYYPVLGGWGFGGIEEIYRAF